MHDDIINLGGIEANAPDDLPDQGHLVYILTQTDPENRQRALVIGRSENSPRPKVIFDEPQGQVTPGHFKAMFVLLHHIHYPADNGYVYRRYYIPCENRNRAIEIETDLHQGYGGNVNTLNDPRLGPKVLNLFENGSPAQQFFHQALLSAYGGVRDLRSWRQAGIINDGGWASLVAILPCIEINN